MTAAPLKLRGYQKGALAQIVPKLNAKGSALLVAPTGAGKTEIIAGLIDGLPPHARVLVVAHLLDLVAQTSDRLARYLPSRSLVTVAATLPQEFQHRGDATEARIVVGTIESIGEVLEHLGNFHVLAIDEAHHSVAPSYLGLIEALKRRNPHLRTMGTTATPERADLKGLDVIFGPTPTVVTMADLIEGGFLVRPRVLGVPLSRIRELRHLQGADAAGMSKSLNAYVVHQEVIRHWKLHGGNKQSVFFCADVAHADGLAKAFREVGVDARSVSHETPTGRRTRLLRKFCRGEGPKVLTNPILLTEGFDAPQIELVGLLRAFVAKSTLIQAVGRGLRPHEATGKDHCLILDYMGAVERHGDLLAGLDLSDRRQPGLGGPGGLRPSVPTIIDYGDAEMLPVHVPNIPAVTFVRPPEPKPPADKPRRIVAGREVVTREEAIAKGLDTFFTGDACAHGHLGDRSTATGACCGCQGTVPPLDVVRSLIAGDAALSVAAAAWRVASHRYGIGTRLRMAKNLVRTYLADDADAMRAQLAELARLVQHPTGSKEGKRRHG